jgi:Uma2 family endonuclease
MVLALKMVGVNGEELSRPYLVRMGGWTEDQYFREAPETQFVEFEDGEVIVHSPARPSHQERTLFLSILLQGYLGRRQLGKVLNGPAVLRLRPSLDYEPDIFVVPTDQFTNIGEEFFAGIPALIVEVISEGTRTHDLKTKALAYRQRGVPEYWAVDLDRKTVFRHLLPADPRDPYPVTEHGRGRLESTAIPGFWIEVAWLWQDPLPDALLCLDQILSR